MANPLNKCDTVAVAATKAAHDLMVLQGRYDYTTAVMISHKAIQAAGRDDASALFTEIDRLVNA